MTTLKKGTLIRVQTKTKEDVFGECLYEIAETGLAAPEKERREAGEKDGVKCVMLGGSGPAARKGFTIIDSNAKIEHEIASGIIEVVPESNRAEIMAYYEDKKKDGTPRQVTGSGIVEM